MIERLVELSGLGGSGTGGGRGKDAGHFDGGFNILRDDAVRAGVAVRGAGEEVVRCWSGWFGERAFEEGTEPEIARWSPKTLTDLEGACERFLVARPGVTLLLRNHHRHALHDHHTLTRFATKWCAGERLGDVRARLGFVLDPAAWLTAQMITDAEDHLQRVADQIEREPLAAMVREVVLTGLAVPSDQDPLSGEKLGVDVGPVLRAVPLDDAPSVLDAAMVRRVFSPVAARGVRVWGVG